jgi:hypothetical protein
MSGSRGADTATTSARSAKLCDGESDERHRRRQRRIFSHRIACRFNRTGLWPGLIAKALCGVRIDRHDQRAQRDLPLQVRRDVGVR